MTASRPSTIVAGERLDALRAVSLRREIDDTIDAGVRQLIVDLGDTEFTDNVGLAAVVHGLLRLDPLGGQLRVIPPRRREAWRLFDLTSFADVLTLGQPK